MDASGLNDGYGTLIQRIYKMGLGAISRELRGWQGMCAKLICTRIPLSFSFVSGRMPIGVEVLPVTRGMRSSSRNIIEYVSERPSLISGQISRMINYHLLVVGNPFF